MKTEQKSEIAILKVKLDLLEKGWFIFESAIDYKLPFDLLICNSQGEIKKIQVKYSTRGVIKSGSGYQSVKQQKHIQTKYIVGDFDYFAVYLPAVDKVIYPSIKYAGCVIAMEVRNSSQPFYWYLDFLSFTDTATYRTCYEFGKEPTMFARNRNKTPIPPRNELESFVMKLSVKHIAQHYNCAHRTVRNWIQQYGLIRPTIKELNRREKHDT